MEYEREPRISTETDLTPKHRKLKETSKKTNKKHQLISLKSYLKDILATKQK